MNMMLLQEAERKAQRLQADREELVERIGRAVREDGTHPAASGAAPGPLLFASQACS